MSLPQILIDLQSDTEWFDCLRSLGHVASLLRSGRPECRCPVAGSHRASSSRCVGRFSKSKRRATYFRCASSRTRAHKHSSIRRGIAVEFSMKRGVERGATVKAYSRKTSLEFPFLPGGSFDVCDNCPPRRVPVPRKAHRKGIFGRTIGREGIQRVQRSFCIHSQASR